MAHAFNSQDIVTFGIPLISKRVAKDFQKVERLLANTLRSIFHQDHKNVHVIIACHEIPAIPDEFKGRVTLVESSLDIPRFRWEQEVDRMRKLALIGVEHRARGGGWLFIIDNDDFVARDVSTRIVQSGKKALVVGNGYRLDALTLKAQKMSRFWRKCGSSNAINWTVDELPEAFPLDNPPLFHKFCETRHIYMPELFQSLGWSYDYLNTPSAVYLINHGQNQSEIISKMTLKWRIYFMLSKWRDWDGDFAETFGVTKSDIVDATYTGTKKFVTEV